MSKIIRAYFFSLNYPHHGYEVQYNAFRIANYRGKVTNTST
jgi:hypothetical protein